MFERYTESARRAVFFARYEAGQRGSENISAAHLLLGLIREKDSRADAVGSLRAKIPDPCELLGIPHRTANPIPLDKKMGPSLNDNAKKVLAYAAREADEDRQFWIDTDHLLRALLCFPNEATPALESIPLELIGVREASWRHRSEFPARPVPLFPKVRFLFRPFKSALVKLALIAIVGLFAVMIIRWVNY